MDVSIIICTYNRAGLLAHCLTSIAGLDPVSLTAGGELEYEVLVVDNASTDKTKDVVEQMSGISNLRYLYERTQGKSYALNLALKEYQGDVVVFCDDDIQLDPKALSEYWSAYQQYSQKYDWFGGRVELDWQTTTAPTWVNDDIQTVLDGALGVHDLGEHSRPYDQQDKYPIGASMMVTRKLVEIVGEFRTDLGPSGELRGASDDTDYLMRAESKGMAGYYLARARAFHHVDPHRLTFRGFYVYGYAKGGNARRADPTATGNIVWGTVLSQLLRGVLQVLKGRFGNARVCLLNIGFEFGKRE